MFFRSSLTRNSLKMMGFARGWFFNSIFVLCVIGLSAVVSYADCGAPYTISIYNDLTVLDPEADGSIPVVSSTSVSAAECLYTTARSYIIGPYPSGPVSYNEAYGGSDSYVDTYFYITDQNALEGNYAGVGSGLGGFGIVEYDWGPYCALAMAIVPLRFAVSYYRGCFSNAPNWCFCPFLNCTSGTPSCPGNSFGPDLNLIGCPACMGKVSFLVGTPFGGFLCTPGVLFNNPSCSGGECD